MCCAIYARFSSDLQDARSITDQVALARQRAEREGWTVIEVYSDAAISGAGMHNRPGLLDMMMAAKARQFGVLLVESLDRLSRDLEDIAGLHKRLSAWTSRSSPSPTARSRPCTSGSRACLPSSSSRTSPRRHAVARSVESRQAACPAAGVMATTWCATEGSRDDQHRAGLYHPAHLRRVCLRRQPAQHRHPPQCRARASAARAMVEFFYP